MNYAKDGSLMNYLHKQGKLAESQARSIMMQLLLALDLMHRTGIIHRDIKSDNILLLD